MDSRICLVMTTCSNQEEASNIARMLTEKRLAACVQVSAPVTSWFYWENQAQCEEEVQLFIKTTGERFEEVREAIVSAHSYELPEVIQVTVTDGLAGYLKWVQNECETN